MTMSNLLGHVVRNSQLAVRHFELREFNFSATKKQLGWVYQALGNLCAVRCQGGFLGFSCCHGSAVTVYGRSCCCDECNNRKVPDRYLGSLTPSLQDNVRKHGAIAIESPDLRFYHKMETAFFHKNVVVCLGEMLSRSPPDHEQTWAARLGCSVFQDLVNHLLSQDQSFSYLNRSLADIFGNTIPYLKTDPVSGLSDDTIPFVQECLLLFHCSLTRFRTMLSADHCSRSAAIRSLRHVLKADDMLRASLVLLEMFHLRLPEKNLHDQLLVHLESFSLKLHNISGSLQDTWYYHQVTRSLLSDRVVDWLKLIHQNTTPADDLSYSDLSLIHI